MTARAGGVRLADTSNLRISLRWHSTYTSFLEQRSAFFAAPRWRLVKTLHRYQWLLIIWACFIVRGIFYCTYWPLWEGFDEWAHFGVIQEMVTTGKVVIDRNTPLSKEINSSLGLAPLPRGMTNAQSRGTIREMYWELPVEERARRESDLLQLPQHWADQHAVDGLPAYEASQPPLYYALIAIPLRAMRHMPLVDRVWLTRLMTFALGSLAIPIGFVLAWRIFQNETVSMAIATLISVMPGMAINLARVSNESLGIVLFTILLLAVCNWIEHPQVYSRTIAVGVTLGLGLLTKAYFLTAIPALAVICVWLIARQRDNRRALVTHTALAFGVALTLGSWWYVRNYLQTGTISGLDEAIVLGGVGFAQKLDAVFRIDWNAAIKTVLASHFWYAGWSTFGLRNSIYRWFYCLAAVAFFGFGVSVVRRRKSRDHNLLCLGMFYGFFCLGLGYQILMLFLSKHSSTALGGWYLYSMVWIEVILFANGVLSLRPLRVPPAVLTAIIVGLAGIDIYAVHFVALPYYAQAKGITSLDVSRLLINKPDFLGARWMLSVWVLYLLSTCTIAVAGGKALLRQGASARMGAS
jgi:hypothetical protein